MLQKHTKVGKSLLFSYSVLTLHITLCVVQSAFKVKHMPKVHEGLSFCMPDFQGKSSLRLDFTVVEEFEVKREI